MERDRERDKQTVTHRESTHQTPFKSAPHFTGNTSRALKRGNEGPSPACIIGESLPGRERERAGEEKVILQSRAFGSRVKFIALAGASQ